VRRLAIPLAMLTVFMLLNGGCGDNGLSGEVLELLETRCGNTDTISYTCVTEDAGSLYREEFEISFPDNYRYRFYGVEGDQARLRTLTVQSGMELYRAGLAGEEPGQAEKLEVVLKSHVPPIRCTGNYLALYHLIGNADYFNSMMALIESGDLVVAGRENLDGTDTYRLESAAGLAPEMRIWLDTETGFPSRKELALSEDRVVVFRYQDIRENQVYGQDSFPPDPVALFGDPGIGVSSEARDGGCRPADMANASAQLGFEPVVPQIQGFELVASYVRNPAESNLTESEASTQFPEGFRQLYLVLRDGTRQVEIMESPYDPEFSYYTTGMAALTGAFLTVQEVFGADAGNASYTAAIDCQEMHLVLGDMALMVTGDLSREEFESLAIQLKDLSAP
jgi:hypothetical protein